MTTETATIPQVKTKSKGKRNRTLLVGAMVIVGAIIYLLISALKGSAVYYLTVGELYARGATVYDKPVRISGTLVEGTNNYDAMNIQLTFELTDDSGTRSLPVVYSGVQPDMFNNAEEIVVEGQYTAAGVFEADNLLLKCPSKYEVEEQAGTGN